MQSPACQKLLAKWKDFGKSLQVREKMRAIYKFLFLWVIFSVILFAKEFKFEYYAPSAQKVNIAGEFNNWDPEKDEMQKSADGFFRIKLDLEPGIYEYKYVIDGEWLSGGNFLFDAYTGKTIKTSNFSWSPHIFWNGFFVLNLTSSSISSNYSLMGSITLNKNVRGFFNLYARGEDENWDFYFERGEFSLRTGKFLIKPFYNRKVLQSQDPLRILKNSSVPLKNRKILFYDEKNKYENFGTDFQGVHINLQNVDFLFADNIYSEEDIVFIQIRGGFFGASFFENRGIKFPYANDSNWFADPEEPLTWQGDESSPRWYKGFVKKSCSEIDFRSTGKFLDIFAQSCLSRTSLEAERWNEEKSADTPISKKWNFYKARKFLFGFKFKNPVEIEGRCFFEKGKFSQFWNFSPFIAQYEIKARHDFKKGYGGIGFVSRKHKEFSNWDVDENFDPYRINYWGELNKTYWKWQEFFLDFGINTEFSQNKIKGKFCPDEKLSEVLLISKNYISFFLFEFSPRFFKWQNEKFFTFSGAIGIKTKLLEIKAGTGLDPCDFLAFNEGDRREEFLYNYSDVIFAEKNLKNQEKLWLRVLLKF